LHTNGLDCTGVFNLCTDADKERLGRRAIKAIHEQMDDDKDGMIEASESHDVRTRIDHRQWQRAIYHRSSYHLVSSSSKKNSNRKQILFDIIDFKMLTYKSHWTIYGINGHIVLVNIVVHRIR
jgi:hypothetical protein